MTRGTDSRTPAWFGRLAFEMFLIFVTVTLALVANGWWQARSDRRTAREVVAVCRAEIERNRRELDAALRAQAAFSKRLEAFETHAGSQPAPRSAEELRDRVKGNLPIQLPVLESAGWELAVHTQALRTLPVSQVKVLSAVHSTQAYMVRMVDRFVGALLAAQNLDPKRALETVRRIRIHLEILTEAERQLRAAYSRALDVLPPSRDRAGARRNARR